MRTALITGGTSGIGEAAVRAFVAGAMQPGATLRG